MRLEKLNGENSESSLGYPISIVVNTEIYGKIVTDCDGNQIFLAEEICAWIGSESLNIPLTVLDKVTLTMQHVIDKQAIKAMEEETRPF